MSARRLAAAVVLTTTTVVTACGGSDEPVAPNAPSNAQVATQLTQLSTRLSASSPAAAYIGLASAGLSFGVQPSSVNVTVSGARAGRVPGLALSTAGSSAAAKFQAVGFRMVLQNVPGDSDDMVLNGGVMWDAGLSEVVVVMGTGSSASFGGSTSESDFALGVVHRVSPEASWLATSGTMSVSAPSTGAACPGTGIPGYTCSLGSFSMGYDITGSMALDYDGSGATGSRTASFGTSSVNGFVITVDYDQLSSGHRALVDDLRSQPR